MNAKELSQKKMDELSGMLEKEQEHVRDLKFRLSGAQLKNFHELHVARKNIARILTVMNAKKKENV